MVGAHAVVSKSSVFVPFDVVSTRTPWLTLRTALLYISLRTLICEIMGITCLARWTLFCMTPNHSEDEAILRGVGLYASYRLFNQLRSGGLPHTGISGAFRQFIRSAT